MRIVAVSFLLLLIAEAKDAKPNPVDKVVDLLKDLKSTIKDDGKKEQKLYDEYACWCEDTLAEKAAAIDEAKETIEDSQKEVTRLGGDLAESGVHIKQLGKEIAENEAGRAKAKEIRDGEHTEYIAKREEGEQCLQALENAIQVLEGAGTKKDLFLGTMKQVEILSAAAGIRNAILDRKSFADQMSDSDLELVRQFADQPEEFEAKKPTMSGAEIGSQMGSQNPHGDYAPASTQILGILKGMYDTFTANLEEGNVAEGDKQKAYEELMKTMKEEHESLTESLQEKTEGHATNTKDKADHRKLLEETKEQLELDEKFFLESKATCKQKSNDWAIRTKMRTEELAGISKAIEILTSDEAKKAFEAANKNEGAKKLFFLQVAAHNSGDPVLHRAYDKLKAMATKFHSLRLASIATEVRTNGHFDKIIVMIDKMIADMRKEEQEDVRLKDICQNEGHASKMAIDDAKYNIKKLEDFIDRQESAKKAKAKEIEAIKKEIEDTEKALEELKKERDEEWEDFKANVKADEDAIAVIGDAITAISKFYSDNKIPMEFVQQPSGPPASGAGSRSQESKGIIGIMEYIREDLQKEIKVAREEEAKADADYQRQRADLTNTLNAQEKVKTTLEGELADIESKISKAEGTMKIMKKEKKALKEEKEALDEKCEWVDKHFEDRRSQRQTEIEGLQNAKSILAGAV